MAQVRIAVIGAGLIGRTHIARASLRQSRTTRSPASPIRRPPRPRKDIARLSGLRRDRGDARSRQAGRRHRRGAEPDAREGRARLHRAQDPDHRREAGGGLRRRSARSLSRPARSANVPILVGHHRRHNPIMRKAAEIIAGGGIGRVVAANGLWLSHKPKDYFDVAWRREAGGGPVLINAIHDIDCLRMLCGDVESVSAAARTRRANSRSRTRRRRCCISRAARLAHCWSPIRCRVAGRGRWGSRENAGPAARYRKLLRHSRHQGLAHGAQSAAPLARAWAGELVGAAHPVARSRASGRCLSRADAQLRECHSRHREAGTRRARRHGHAGNHARHHALRTDRRAGSRRPT